MKRRILKPIVEKVITAITVFQLMFLCSINDFKLSAIPFLIAFLGVFGFNVMILKKYSKNPLTNWGVSAIMEV